MAKAEVEKLVKNERANKRDVFNCIRDEVNELSSDFEAWNKTIFDKLMFFHKNGKSDYTGICECGATVQLSKARTGEYITCAACQDKVRLRDDRYNHHYEETAVSYIQRTIEGWMQRLFLAHKSWAFKDGNINIYYSRDEEERDHIDEEGHYYEFHPSQCNRDDWKTGPGHVHGSGWCGWRVQGARISTYPGNLKMLFCNSKYKYSQIETATRCSRVNPFFYLLDYNKYPKQLEMLYKVGLYNLGAELLGYGYDYAAKIAYATLRDFGIESKEDLAAAVKLDCGYNELNALRRIKGWSIQEEQRLAAVKFMRELNSQGGEDFEYSFISNERLFKYYLTQQKSFKACRDFIRDYRDYISNAITLKMNVCDTKIKMPKDFKYCEQIVSARAAERLADMRKRKARTKAKNLKVLFAEQAKQLAYADKKYTIVVPNSEQDLKREGENNCNCVYTYVDRILEHRSIVIFLRKADEADKSFCTVEIEPITYRVIQCRSKGNSTPPEDARKWIDKYAESLRKKAAA